MIVTSGDVAGPAVGSRVGVGSFRVRSLLFVIASSMIAPLAAARWSVVRECQVG